MDKFDNSLKSHDREVEFAYDVQQNSRATKDGAIRSAKYSIITPIRDEEEFISKTVESVVAQTNLPQEWIIVDDGSTDDTPAIINRYAQQYPWITALRRENRGFRSTGGGIDGFLFGYENLRMKDWEFLVNLDGDLSFAPDYFEKCFSHFRQNSKLGIGGGTIYNKIGESLQAEHVAQFHVRGATKIYRRACWDALGGMYRGLGWDTVDEVTANMRGWQTMSFPELPLTHYRVTGTAGGMWWGLVKDGYADYIVGYHPLFFAAKCIRRVFKPPFVVGAVGLSAGFLRGYWKGLPKVEDRKFVSYLRRQQLRRLFGLSTIWR
jgi:poly-beta-1,6-N-acetyl-D-glucosamine synthase